MLNNEEVIEQTSDILNQGIDNAPTYQSDWTARPFTYNPTSGTSSVGSIARSLTSGLIAGFTGFNLYSNEDERDSSKEGLTYSLGHLFGLMGMGVGAILTGGIGGVLRGGAAGVAKIATGRAAAGIISKKLVGEAALAHTESTFLKSSIKNLMTGAVKAERSHFSSVPQWLTDQAMYIGGKNTNEMRIGFDWLVKGSGKLGAGMGLKQQVAENIMSRGLHMGVLMGIASEPLNNALDPETWGTRLEGAGHGFVFGAAMGGIGNLFSKTGIATNQKWFTGFDAEKLATNPWLKKHAEKGARMVSLSIFQTLYGREEDTPTEVDIFNIILGGVFGFSEKSWAQAQTQKYLAKNRYGKDPLSGGDLLKKITEQSEDFKALEPEVQKDVEAYVRSDLGKLFKDGDQMIASEAGLAMFDATNGKLIGDLTDTTLAEVTAKLDILYNEGTIKTKTQYDTMLASATMSLVKAGVAKQRNQTIEDIDLLLASDGKLFQEVLTETLATAKRFSTERSINDVYKELNKRNDAVAEIISKETIKQAIEDGDISLYALNPIFSMAKLFSRLMPGATPNTIFEKYIKDYSTLLKNGMIERINSNKGKASSEKEILTDKDLALAQFLNNITLEATSFSSPEAVEALKNSFEFRAAQSAFLTMKSSVKADTFSLNIGKDGSIGMKPTGSMDASGNYINLFRARTPFEAFSGEIYLVDKVEADGSYTVKSLSQSIAESKNPKEFIVELIISANQAKTSKGSLVFVSGNKDKDQLVFSKWVIDPKDEYTNQTMFTKFLHFGDLALRKKDPLLESFSVAYQKSRDRFIEAAAQDRELGEEEIGTLETLYRNIVLNNIKLNENRNTPLEERLSLESIAGPYIPKRALTLEESNLGLAELNAKLKTSGMKAELVDGEVVLSFTEVKDTTAPKADIERRRQETSLSKKLGFPVTITSNPQFEGHIDYSIRNEKGEEIARFYGEWTKKGIKVIGVGVPENFRKGGIAKNLYRALNEQAGEKDGILYSDGTFSFTGIKDEQGRNIQPALKLWEGLIKTDEAVRTKGAMTFNYEMKPAKDAGIDIKGDTDLLAKKKVEYKESIDKLEEVGLSHEDNVIAEFFHVKFNLPIQFANIPGEEGKTIPAFFQDGNVYINQSYLRTAKPDGMPLERYLTHEFTHVILEKIRSDDPIKFKDIYLDLITSPEHTELVKQTTKKLHSLYPNLSEQDVSFLAAKIRTDKLNVNPISSKFTKFLANPLPPFSVVETFKSIWMKEGTTLEEIYKIFNLVTVEAAPLTAKQKEQRDAMSEQDKAIFDKKGEHIIEIRRSKRKKLEEVYNQLLSNTKETEYTPEQLKLLREVLPKRNDTAEEFYKQLLSNTFEGNELTKSERSHLKFMIEDNNIQTPEQLKNFFRELTLDSVRKKYFPKLESSVSFERNRRIFGSDKLLHTRGSDNFNNGEIFNQHGISYKEYLTKVINSNAFESEALIDSKESTYAVMKELTKPSKGGTERLQKLHTSILIKRFDFITPEILKQFKENSGLSPSELNKEVKEYLELTKLDIEDTNPINTQYSDYQNQGGGIDYRIYNWALSDLEFFQSGEAEGGHGQEFLNDTAKDGKLAWWVRGDTKQHTGYDIDTNTYTGLPDKSIRQNIFRALEAQGDLGLMPRKDAGWETFDQAFRFGVDDNAPKGSKKVWLVHNKNPKLPWNKYIPLSIGYIGGPKTPMFGKGAWKPISQEEMQEIWHNKLMSDQLQLLLKDRKQKPMDLEQQLSTTDDSIKRDQIKETYRKDFEAWKEAERKSHALKYLSDIKIESQLKSLMDRLIAEGIDKLWLPTGQTALYWQGHHERVTGEGLARRHFMYAEQEEMLDKQTSQREKEIAAIKNTLKDVKSDSVILSPFGELRASMKAHEVVENKDLKSYTKVFTMTEKGVPGETKWEYLFKIQRLRVPVDDSSIQGVTAQSLKEATRTWRVWDSPTESWKEPTPEQKKKFNEDWRDPKKLVMSERGDLEKQLKNLTEELESIKVVRQKLVKTAIEKQYSEDIPETLTRLGIPFKVVKEDQVEIRLDLNLKFERPNLEHLPKETTYTWYEIDLKSKDVMDRMILFAKTGEITSTNTDIPKNPSDSWMHELIANAIQDGSKPHQIKGKLQTITDNIVEWVRKVLAKMGFENIKDIKSYKDLERIMNDPSSRLNLAKARDDLSDASINTFVDQISSMSRKDGSTQPIGDTAKYKSNFLLNASEMNKRSQILFSANPKFNPNTFASVLDVIDGKFTDIFVNPINLNGMTRFIGMPDQDPRGLDGVSTMRGDIMDLVLSEAGIESKASSHKGVTVSVTGYGGSYDKKANHRGGEVEDKIMHAYGLHNIRYLSATKQIGNNPVYDMVYDPAIDQAFFYESGTTNLVSHPGVQTNIESYTHNTGVKEVMSDATSGSMTPLQMFGTLESHESIKEAMDQSYLPSIQGDPLTNAEFTKIMSLQNDSRPHIKDEASKVRVDKEINDAVNNLNIDQLSSENIVNIIYGGKDVPVKLYSALMDKILKIKDIEQIGDREDTDLIDAFKYHGVATKIIDALGTGTTTLNLPMVFPYVDAMVRRFIVDKYVRPFTKDIAKVVMFPNDLTGRVNTLKALGRDLKVGEALMGENIANERKGKLTGVSFIDLLAERSKITKEIGERDAAYYEEAINTNRKEIQNIQNTEGVDPIERESAHKELVEYERDLIASANEFKSIQDRLKIIDKDLTITSLRVPSPNISGVRVVKIIGLTGRSGNGVQFHPEDMFYMGGADVDFDTAFLHFGMSDKLKAVFQSHSRDLHNEDGTYKELYEIDSKPVDFDNTTYTHPFSLLDPLSLFEANRFAEKGKSMVGPIIVNLNRMNLLRNTVKYLDGYVTKKRIAKMYLDQLLLDPRTNQTISADQNEVLANFYNGTIDFKQAEEESGIKLSNITWKRTFKTNSDDITKFRDANIKAAEAAVDASGGTPITDRKTILSRLNNTILHPVVLSFAGKNNAEYILKVNQGMENVLESIDSSISLYSNGLYQQLANLDAVISGKLTFLDKNDNLVRRKIHPVEMILLAKSSLNALKKENVFHESPDGALLMKNMRYRAVAEMAKLNVDKTFVNATGGKFLQEFKDNYDQMFRDAEHNTNKTDALDIANNVFRHPQWLRIKGNPELNPALVNENLLTLNELLNRYSSEQIRKLFERMNEEELADTYDFSNKDETLLESHLRMSQMHSQDIYDATSFMAIYEASQTALSHGISKERLMQLALHSADFKDGISRIDEVRNKVPEYLIPKGSENSDVIDLLSKYRAMQLSQDELAFFDTYLLSSFFPHLKYKADGSGEAIAISYRQALKDVVEFNQTNLVDKDVKKEIESVFGKISPIEKTEMDKKVRKGVRKTFYRTDANRILWVINEVNPNTFKRFGEIFKGISKLTYRDDITLDMLKDIFPPYNKNSQEVFTKRAMGFTTSKKLFPDLDELETPDSAVHELALKIIEQVGIKKEDGIKLLTEKRNELERERSNILAEKHNSLFELGKVIKEKEGLIDLKLGPEWDPIIEKLRNIMTEHPSLYLEFETWFSGITSSLADIPSNYMSNTTGASPRFATKIDLLKFIDTYEKQKVMKGVPRPLRRTDFFRYLRSIGEDLTAHDPIERSFSRGVVSSAGGSYETSMKYFDSTMGKMSSLFAFNHQTLSGETARVQDYLSDELRFTALLEPKIYGKLLKVAIRKLELGQGEMYPDLLDYYKDRLAEVEPEYEASLKNMQFRFNLKTGEFTSGEQIVTKFIDTIRGFNRLFNTQLVRNDKIKAEYFKFDDAGNINVNKTIDGIIQRIEDGQKIDLTHDALYELIHEIKINKIQIAVNDKEEPILLGDIIDPSLKRYWKNELRQRNVKIDYDHISFSQKQLDSYYPHNGFTKATQRKLEREMIEKIYLRQYNDGKAESEKMNMMYDIAESMGMTAALDQPGIDMLNMQHVTPEQMTESGIHHVAGPLKARSRNTAITHGYQEDFKSYDIYGTQLVKSKYNLINTIIGHRLIDQFTKSKSMGEEGSRWEMFMHLFIRDNIGYPSTFPKEWTEDKKFTGKLNPYWLYTDQASLNAIERISKTFFGGKSFFRKITPQEGNFIVPLVGQFTNPAKYKSFSSRTEAVIEESDAVITIDYNTFTAGHKDTFRTSQRLNKKYIPLKFKQDFSEREVEMTADILAKAKIGSKELTLNIAGNGISNFHKNISQGNIDYSVFSFLKKLQIKLADKYGVSISKVITGGQTGVDEAGSKAAMRLAIPNKIISTHDWAIITRDGNRIASEAAFKARFSTVLTDAKKDFDYSVLKESEINKKIEAVLLHKKLTKWTMLEGKWELLSLLSHPKYIIGNILGGLTNDVIIAGLSPRMRALNSDYLTKHVDNSRIGKESWSRFVHENGGIESMWSEEFAEIRIKYGDKVDSAIEQIKSLFGKNLDPTVEKASIADIFNSLGMDNLTKLASSFIKGSERYAREKSWLSHYLKAFDLFDSANIGMEANHPWLIMMANRGVAASQFIYNNARKPAFMRTPIGTLFTRFQNYYFNSVGLRARIYKEAKAYGFSEGTEAHSRLQRMIIADTFAMTLATLFPMSIFQSTLPAPYDYLRNISTQIYGTDEEKKRPGYGIYSAGFPLNTLQPVLPTFSRIVFPWFLLMSSGDWDHISRYYMYSMFPYGLLARDTIKTLDNPTMIAENMFRIPLHGLHYKLKKKNDSFKFIVPEDNYLDEDGIFKP